MTAPAFTSLGKEVLHNGEHYADARDVIGAQIIAAALNATMRKSDHPTQMAIAS